MTYDSGERWMPESESQLEQQRARGAVTVLARIIATAAGAGYAPVAPGTFGTLVAVPLAWALAGCDLLWFGVICAAVTLAGIWAAGVADRAWGSHDSGRIV